MRSINLTYLRVAAVAGIMAAALYLAPAAQAVSPTGTASANAKITVAIYISWTADLNFGEIYSPLGAETVTIGTADDRTGNANILGSDGTPTSAKFDIHGAPDYQFSIELPGSISLSDGDDHTMTVGDFTSSLGSSSTLDGDGDAALAVGASLTVGANQAAGVYSGTFDVTVQYE